MVEATKSEVLTGNDSSYESELLSPKAQIKELEATSQEPAQPENTPKKDEKAATPCQGLQKDPSGSSNLGANVPETFEKLLKSEPELATALAAVKTLMIVLDKCSAKTLQELIKLLREAVDQMKKEVDCSACSVQSGCELFLRFITLAAKLEVRPCLYQTIVTIKFTGKVE